MSKSKTIIILSIILTLGLGTTACTTAENLSQTETQIAETFVANQSNSIADVYQMLSSNLSVSDDNALMSAAKRLVDIGCLGIREISIKNETETAYTIAITDTGNKSFFTTIDKNGYIGAIQDGDGTYLYEPLE